MTLQLLNIRITNSTRRNLKFENSILSWAVGLVQYSAQHSQHTARTFWPVITNTSPEHGLYIGVIQI